MTDLELTKLCAEAMGYAIVEDFHGFVPPVNGIQVEIDKSGVERSIRYNPISDDAQAMALVKKFKLSIHFDTGLWWVRWLKNIDIGEYQSLEDQDLNRAICECVAKMQPSRDTNREQP